MSTNYSRRDKALFPIAMMPWARLKNHPLYSVLVLSLTVLCSVVLRSAVTRADEGGDNPLPNDEISYRLSVDDAQGYSPNLGGGIDGDPAGDVNQSWMRTGAFADGMSVLVIKMQPLFVTQMGDVTFRLTHTNPNPAFPQTADFVGSLWATFPSLPAPDPGAEMGATELTIHAGSPKILYYLPPNNFRFGKTPLTQVLNIDAVSGGVLEGFVRINLTRPTAVLVHGFTSNPGNMATMQAALTAGGRLARVRCLDWSDINTSGYDSVPIRVKQIIADEVQWQRSNGVAATRLDFFGHSMGGVVVKWYAGNLGDMNVDRNLPVDYGFPRLIQTAATTYLRADNFGCGDIHRFVSVGAPFRGSPFGDVASSVLGWDGLVLIVANTAGLGGDATSFNDLGELGRGTFVLQTAHPTISWYPIVGIGSSAVGVDIPGRTQEEMVHEGPAFILSCISATPADLGLLPGDSDFVVPHISQVDRGSGPFPPAGLTNTVATNITHTEEASNVQVSNYLLRALDLMYSTSDPPGYPYFNTGF